MITSGQGRGLVMDRVKIDLENCYGIKSLRHEFDFTKKAAYAIYAPNGSMKSSLAKTFEDAATGGQPSDRHFPARPTKWSLLDDKDAPIAGARILVFGPIDDKFDPSAKTSTLLVNAALRGEYEKLHKDIDAAKAALIAALKKQAGTKADLETEISNAYMRRPNAFETAMGRLQPELKAAEAILACCRFRRHRVRCFDGTGGGSWNDGSSRESSSLRRRS